MTGRAGVRRAISMDGLVVLSLVLTNPVLFCFNSSLARFPPDTIKYVTLAKSLPQRFDLYLSAFGHVDLGQILPPLYPSLIAIGSIFSDNLLATAEYVSSMALIMAIPPLYLLLVRATSRVTAVGTLFLIQISGFFLEQALMPLTEALFICVTAWALLLAGRAGGDGGTRWVTVLAGVVSAMVFLTRQIGIVFVGMSLLAMALETLVHRGAERADGLRRLGAFVGGLGVVLGPYALVVFLQTGQHPLTQTFRKGDYGIQATVEDLEVIDRLAGGASGEISEVYAKRRRMRRLNPASSEMYVYLVEPTRANGQTSSWTLDLGDRLVEFPRRLVINLGHVRGYLGVGWLALFVGSFLWPIVGRGDGARSGTLKWLWMWNASYLAALSLLTAKIDRYVVVILPFAMIQVAWAGYGLGRFIEDRAGRTSRGWLGRSVVASVLVVGAAFMPSFFWSLERREKTYETALPLQSFREAIAPEEPVFSLTQLEAYVVGGTFRVLPNDSLERIVEYGRRTGVRWLVVRRDAAAFREAQLYDNAPWYEDDRSIHRNGTRLRLRVATEDGSLRLYEFGAR